MYVVYCFTSTVIIITNSFIHLLWFLGDDFSPLTYIMQVFKPSKTTGSMLSRPSFLNSVTRARPWFFNSQLSMNKNLIVAVAT